MMGSIDGIFGLGVNFRKNNYLCSMMTERAKQWAEQFAKNHGLNIVNYLTEKDGWEYYHLTADFLRGKKVGLPPVIKISVERNRLMEVERLDEIMWAINQPASK